MDDKIRVTILDDHQSIVDGYIYRLGQSTETQVVATIAFGDHLEETLNQHPTDVLLLDVNVPAGPESLNPYPILYLIPKLLQIHSGLNILVISMYAERGLIRAVMEAGASGYILKDDQSSLQGLANLVVSVAAGGIYFSPRVHEVYARHLSKDDELLTGRQLEVLSLSAAYPNSTTAELAKKMTISNSTVRNLLSAAYLKLEVNNRTAAIARARQLGLILPN
jgi:DNA-binding NarL/FixJ family response regulator